jgi:hypothetical protein
MTGESASWLSGAETKYPANGGLFYGIQPDNRMVVTLEWGQGKDSNRGGSFRFGCGFSVMALDFP